MGQTKGIFGLSTPNNGGVPRGTRPATGMGRTKAQSLTSVTILQNDSGKVAGQVERNIRNNLGGRRKSAQGKKRLSEWPPFKCRVLVKYSSKKKFSQKHPTQAPHSGAGTQKILPPSAKGGAVVRNVHEQKSSPAAQTREAVACGAFYNHQRVGNEAGKRFICPDASESASFVAMMRLAGD